MRQHARKSVRTLSKPRKSGATAPVRERKGGKERWDQLRQGVSRPAQDSAVATTFPFEIVTPGRTFHMRASSLAAGAAWVETLEWHIDSARHGRSFDKDEADTATVEGQGQHSEHSARSKARCSDDLDFDSLATGMALPFRSRGGAMTPIDRTPSDSSSSRRMGSSGFHFLTHNDYRPLY